MLSQKNKGHSREWGGEVDAVIDWKALGYAGDPVKHGGRFEKVAKAATSKKK